MVFSWLWLMRSLAIGVWIIVVGIQRLQVCVVDVLVVGTKPPLGLGFGLGARLGLGLRFWLRLGHGQGEEDEDREEEED